MALKVLTVGVLRYRGKKMTIFNKETCSFPFVNLFLLCRRNQPLGLNVTFILVYVQIKGPLPSSLTKAQVISFRSTEKVQNQVPFN